MGTLLPQLVLESLARACDALLSATLESGSLRGNVLVGVCILVFHVTGVWNIWYRSSKVVVVVVGVCVDATVLLMSKGARY